MASREALSSIHIYQVDMRDVPSALRSLSAVPDGDLPALEEAIRLRRSLESTQLMDMEAANQAHLDAAAVVVAPSQGAVALRQRQQGHARPQCQERQDRTHRGAESAQCR